MDLTTTSTPTPPADTTPTVSGGDGAAMELEAMVFAALPTAEAGVEVGIEGVHAMPVEFSGRRQLWVVHSVGIRSFDPLIPHFVAVYERVGEQWQELDRVMLEAPDFLAEGSVGLLPVPSDDLWLEVQGGTGAHSGTFDLLRFNGQTLSQELEYIHSSPGAGRLMDLNQDGTVEIVLDASNPYLFCYACGVRLTEFSVLRWTGNGWASVRLELLPESAPEALRERNNRMVQLAQARLLKDAWSLAQDPLLVASDNPTVMWNVALVQLFARAASEQARESGYPLLDNVFYGEYEGALAFLRQYAPDQLFTPDTPLVAGSVAEGWEEVLYSTLIDVTTGALAVSPELAGAHFLRGWARYQVEPGARAALDDLEAAVALAPEDAFFAKSLAYVKENLP